ncbi:uncharacterized protein PFB0145c isoform X3 [Anoplophora glabripennis]|uniref:uncharacterized protein PFB0145c isoform X3 n=1 Tax=Anoplophora glabripennis TaxID=217634 RepID=UPI0008756125|nr:uncharacterized protein PFB0145c isoform X3 [Anoplophora glabripennis]
MLPVPYVSSRNKKCHMQNAGQQFGQGGAPSHQGAAYGHTESSQTATGSITSSLRQFRKKDVDKQQVSENGTTVAESHVARVAPHNHYPPRPQDCYRYPPQFPDYALPSQVKYSEISDHQPLQEQISPSVIQKAKGKEYMEMCNVPQPHMKQGYPDQLNNQQPYGTDPNLHPHAQYLQKDPQVHPSYKPESQYYPKEAQYQQLPPQMQKYNMPPQMRKYPTENDFLSKLRRIHPTMARSIMSEHHLQESQSSYQPMDQNRIYPHQNQRYMNYTAPMQNNPYPHGYMPPQPYSNYPPSCSYTRSPQMPQRFPSTNPHERSISPRRTYTDNLPIPPMNYTAIPQRISPNYPQYNTPEYAQHYQHRRGPVAPQEFYPQPCRTTQYMPHQMPQPELAENRVTVSDSIKQYIENWADEETASEMNQMETNRLCKENLRNRDEQSTETVYMINASELQYLENGIPLVTSENGIPLVTSENGQYFLKSGVTIDNSTGMVRIVEKPTQIESAESTVDRVVNLHIMDPVKPDCMLANKPSESSQRQNENMCNMTEKTKVVIHQNTVIQSSQVSATRKTGMGVETEQFPKKVGTSLPILVENGVTADVTPLEEFTKNVFKESKKETVDKNCSPINMEQIENGDDFNENPSVICPLKLLEDSVVPQEEKEVDNVEKLKNMPIIDLLPEENKDKDEKPTIAHANQTQIELRENTTSDDECETKNDSDTTVTNNDNSPCSNTDRNDDTEIKNIPDCKEIVENDNNNTEKIAEIVTGESDVIKEPKQETKEITTELTKEITDEPPPSETVEEIFENDVPENRNEATNTIDVDNTMITKNNETENTVKDCSTTDQNPSVNIPASKEINKESENNIASTSNYSEKKPITSFSDIFFEQTVNKSTTRRAKRIFSVDDIINNIGNNTNKSKLDTQFSERRRSLQITREFLEREIDASHIFPLRLVSNEHLTDICEEKKEEKEMDRVETVDACEEQVNQIKGITDEENKEKEQITEENDSTIKESNIVINEEEKLNVIASEKVEEEEMITKESEVTEKEEIEETKQDHPVNETKELEISCNRDAEEKVTVNITVEPIIEKQVTNFDNKDDQTETNEDSVGSVTNSSINKEDNTSEETNICTNEMKLPICDDSIVNNVVEEQEVMIDKADSYDNSHSADTTPEVQTDLAVKEIDLDVATDNEVHYRNAIRVDENNVLLEIAGELVEISVNIINGKKVITVLPLSESTMVDFNDNYETLDTTQVDEGIKTNASDDEHNLETSQLLSNDEVPPEPDVIESTSEIIIGLDISLEEEIQLDLEKPPSLSTKAAKKCYENDLQIPSITTSEDITDNNKVTSYSPNDKVSSSKEQRPEKFKSERKKVGKSLNASKKSSTVKKKHTDDKSIVKELMKIRKVKETLQQRKDEEEVEEFVPFKELIKARKLKKMKLQQMKSDENVSADSTNRLDQEESSELDSETKQENCTHKEDTTEIRTKEKETSEGETIESVSDVTKDDNGELVEETKTKDISKTKDYQFKVQKSYKTEQKRKKANNETKSEYDAKSIKRIEVTESITEKAIKKVTFGSVSYSESEKSLETFHSEVKNYRLEDPRLKSRPNCGILVPSVSELLNESDRLANNKKKLSLAEYNNRKRKLAVSTNEKETKIRKINLVPYTEPKPDIKRPKEPLNRAKMSRPKSLDDIKLFGKPKDPSLMKRKFSLEVTSSKPNYFDWEETQSPKTNLESKEDPQKRLSEFRGLINNNKSKVVVDVSDLKPPTSEGSEDEILQNYKEQVDSKLSSLNLQIPRAAKPPTNIINPFSNTETITLMQRFLRNEKLSGDEMEKIKKIISYKRLMQQLDRIKSPGLSNSPLNPSYEIRKNCTEKEMKLHLKKVPEKKKKRFRNLYTDSTTESDSDFCDFKRNNGDYSVVQSNSYAAGVPKLIIKRKTEMPVPVVRLERLDLNLLNNRKRKFC